jgi:propanol-preferring alcohol dehydrogenase
VVQHFPFEKAPEAYDLLHHGKINGRAVMLPNG